jgi:biopolymer transport protein ExbD
MIGSKGISIGARRNDNLMAEINTTPLVDVMLVLLVIFIITAPFLTHAVKIDLPKATSKLLQEQPEIISIAIDHSGSIFWNDQVIEKRIVIDKLKQVAQKDNPPEIHLRADKDTRYQVLAEIMASAQNAGITKLGFVSEPE